MVSTRAASWSRVRGDTVLALITFFYWLTHENIFFLNALEVGGPLFYTAVNALKFCLPVVLLVAVGLPPVSVLTRGRLSLYAMLFAGFLVWALVPTVLFGDVETWVKFAIRFPGFVAVAALWRKRPNSFITYAKCLVVVVIVALAQLIMVYLTGSYNDDVAMANGTLAGPFGLYGNVAAQFYLPGVPMPIVRLSGLWQEPSLAASSAYGGFFLCKYLVAVGESRKWRAAGYACLVAGVLTMSNAGAFAFGLGLLAGVLFKKSKLTVRHLGQFAVVLPLTALLLFVAFGRSYFVEHAGGNVWVLALTGTRSMAVGDDPTSGRLELFQATIDATKQNWIGVGVQPVGFGGIPASASAPVMWLLLTGVPGLLLLVGRELTVLAAARRLGNRPALIPLVQALVVVMAQQLSYGTWMTPHYFALAAIVLVSASGAQRSLPGAMIQSGDHCA